MNKLLTGLGIVLTAIILITPSPVFAADVDLTVSPVFFDFSPNPGDTLKDKIRLHNNTSAPISITVSIDSMGIDENGDVVPQALPDQQNSNWFTFTNTKFSVPANEWMDVPFSVNIPPQAAFGNYFAITFSPQVQKTPGTNALIQGNVVVPVLLNVQKAGSVATAKIDSFQVGRFVNEFPPVTFSVSLTNTGNIHLAPRGNIFIRGRGDKDVAILNVNSVRSNILPGATRIFTSDWSDGFIVRKNNSLSVNWNKLTDFRIGKYTAYVLLAYDDGKRDVPIEATTTFWVFPYTAVAVSLGTVVLLFIMISSGLKALVKREAKKLRS